MGQVNLRLANQIHNRIKILARFDLGTQSTIDTDCRLARGNPQWPGVLRLFSKS